MEFKEQIKGMRLKTFIELLKEYNPEAELIFEEDNKRKAIILRHGGFDKDSDLNEIVKRNNAIRVTMEVVDHPNLKEE